MKNICVCLDSGHGGRQPGAVSSTFGYKEKDIALSITKMVYAYLSYAKKDSSNDWLFDNLCQTGLNSYVNVIMTRVTDVDLSLSNRCNIANENKATCFVSIHCNSYDGVSANGIETWYYKGGLAQSKLFAQKMQTCIIEETKTFKVKESDGTSHMPKDRGIKPNSSYYTLRHTTMPSLVVECGFMSHQGEVQLMMTQEYQDALGRGIAKGILHTFCN